MVLVILLCVSVCVHGQCSLAPDRSTKGAVSIDEGVSIDGSSGYCWDGWMDGWMGVEPIERK